MSDPHGDDPGARATLDDAAGPARNTMPDPLVHGDGDAPPRTTLPDLGEHDDAPRDEPADEQDAAAADGAAPDGNRPTPPRRSWVYFLVGGLFFAAFAGPLLFYFFVWRYRPTAVQHIPEGTNAALRVDGNELYLFAPFRDEVLSVFAESRDAMTLADRLKKYTSIDVRTDLREVVVATTSGDGYVVLLGGKFERTRLSQDKLVKGLDTFFKEEGVDGFSLDGDVLVGRGFYIAQADDSTIIIASHPEGQRAAMEATDAWTRLGLSSSGAASFVIERPALAAAARSLPPVAGAALAKTERVGGFLTLGAEPAVFVEASPTSGTDPETLAHEIEGSLDAARLLMVLLPDAIGEKSAISNAKVKPRATSVMIETKWPKDGLERGAKSLGSTLRAVFDVAPGAEP